MIDVPGETPAAKPVPTFTVAIAGALLLHVPDGGVVDSADETPVHKFVLPVIGVGVRFTVTYTLVDMFTVPSETLIVNESAPE